MIAHVDVVRPFDDSPLAVSTEGLTKLYGTKPGLTGLDLCVPEGAVYVLAGPNGAGKTTTLRLLLGLTRPDTGRSQVFDRDPLRQGGEVRAAIGYVPEAHHTPYAWMKVGRMLAHLAAYRPNWDDGYAERLTRELELATEEHYGELSKGEARRVQLAAALAHRPPLLLFDEPTDGLDPVMRERFFALLADHLAAAASPTTVVLSTHLVQETELLASHLGVLRGGRLSLQLESAELEARLCRYRADVKEGFADAAELENAVVERREARGEIDWVIWGDRERVLEKLRGAGAHPRHVRPLSLDEAAKTWIRCEEDT